MRKFLILLLLPLLCACEPVTPVSDSQVSEVGKLCDKNGMTLKVHNTQGASVAVCEPVKK